METNYFKSFDELDLYLKDALTDIGFTQREILRAIWMHLRQKIRDAHWKDVWPLKSRSNPNSPLLKTWALRAAVKFKTTTNTVEVYSDKEWLAVIHEYWVTYKMTKKQRKFLFGVVFEAEIKTKWRPRKSWGSGMVTIPARPIWRRIIALEENNVYAIAEKYFNNIFK